uniref:Uncharacterized protein n=1 Tax=Caenorhabditis japonica TaxID=281687 RepID=A0A8R1EM00_CAEJA
MLKDRRPVKPVRPMRLDTPVKPDHVRFVCIGCTHGEPFDLTKLPPGDVLWLPVILHRVAFQMRWLISTSCSES